MKVENKLRKFLDKIPENISIAKYIVKNRISEDFVFGRILMSTAFDNKFYVYSRKTNDVYVVTYSIDDLSSAKVENIGEFDKAKEIERFFFNSFIEEAKSVILKDVNKFRSMQKLPPRFRRFIK